MEEPLPRWIRIPSGILLALMTLFVFVCGIAMLVVAESRQWLLVTGIGVAIVLLSGWCLDKSIRMITGRGAHRGLLSPLALRIAAVVFVLLPVGGLFTGYYERQRLQAVVQAVVYFVSGAALWQMARRRGASALRTERLELTPATLADVDLLHRMWTDPDVRRYLWDDVAIDRETARAVVEQNVRDWAARRYGFWVVRERGGEDAIGFVGFRSSNEADDPELLFGLLPRWWKRGYAVEAGAAALQYLARELGRTSAWAATDAPNAASARVLERLGMVRDDDGSGRMHVYRIGHTIRA